MKDVYRRLTASLASPALLPLLVPLITAMPSIGETKAIDVQTLTQAMIDEQGGETLLLGLDFGADPSSPIKFTSTIDLVAMSYSFATLPGSTYEGQTLTMKGMGVFDPTTDIMTTNSSTTFGSASFTSSGTDTIDLSADPKKDSDDIKYVPDRMTKDGKRYNDLHIEDFKFPDGTSMGTDFLTLNMVKVPGTDSVATDRYFSSTGVWNTRDEVIAIGIGVVSVGSSPPTGGQGTFTVTVVPVPEPSGIALLSCGLLGILIRYGRRRLRRHHRLPENCDLEEIGEEIGFSV